MDIAIRKPRIVSRSLQMGLMELLGGETGYADSTNGFVADSFVTLTSGALIGVVASSGAIPANATTNGASPKVMGYVRDASKSSNSVDPPNTMYPNQKHFPVSVRGVRFAMNIATIAANALVIGEANSAVELSDVTIGGSYELAIGGSTANSGTYSGYYVVNQGGTTNPMVRIVDIPAIWGGIRQTPLASTFNGVVIVEFLDSVILVP